MALPVGVLYDVLMKPKQCQLEEEEHIITTNNNNNNNTLLPWKMVHFSIVSRTTNCSI